MKARLFFAILSVFFVAVIASCSDDEETGIYFTQDLLSGDINTGKQKIINELSVYSGFSAGCKVRGCEGTVSAASSDESVATATISTADDGTLLTINGASEGTAIITVCDEAGQTATLQVSVSALPYVRYQCQGFSVNIGGASDSEAESIRLDIMESVLVFRSFELVRVPTTSDSNTWCLYIYDASDSMVSTMYGTKKGEGGSFEFYLPNSETWCGLQLSDDEATIDLTELYKKEYTDIKYVELILKIDKVQN